MKGKSAKTVLNRIKETHELHYTQTAKSKIHGWDGMGYAVGTGVATALKVVQRHCPFLANPKGKAG